MIPRRFSMNRQGRTPPKPKVTDDALLDVINKAGMGVASNWYDMNEVEIARHQYGDISEPDDSLRRAIHTISNWYNTLGIFRDDFNKSDSDTLARNAHYALCEKAMMDYLTVQPWTVLDSRDKSTEIQEAIDFLEYPNPQDSFSDIMKPTLRDTIRYDAGVWVKSFTRGGYLSELKPYLGTEFWKEIDHVKLDMPIPYQDTTYTSMWSHGYTQRYWQRSRTGLYIPFNPEEICYFVMYPRTDGVYGTDFLKFLKYQIQYLVDSTRAAGKTFENGIVPSLVWEHPDIANREVLYERLKQVNANRGSYRFGSILHTVGQEKVSTVSSTLHDMEWLEGQRFVASLIWSMWGFSASEFIGDEESRATAYVKRNITKSRMIQPILAYWEQKINREVLPYMKGYRKYWKFEFVRDLDLDDELKKAQINSQKATTFSTLINTGVQPSIAVKLAELGDDLSTEEIESFDDMVSAFGFDDGMVDPGDEGRYGSDNYTPVDVGGSAPHTEHKDRVEEFEKSGRNYISDPSNAPKGASVRRGSRGGYYYVGSPDTTGKVGKIGSSKHHRITRRSDHSSRGGEEKETSSKPATESHLDIMDSKQHFTLKGSNFVLKVGVIDGKVKGYMRGDGKPIVEQIKKLAKGNGYAAIKKAAATLAEQEGYRFNEN